MDYDMSSAHMDGVDTKTTGNFHKLVVQAILFVWKQVLSTYKLNVETPDQTSHPDGPSYLQIYSIP